MFTWLESSGLATMINESLWGYPIALALHAIGMSIFVGLSFMVGLRMLGFFKGLPLAAVHTCLKIAWIGFWVNLISGFSLFSGQASYFVGHTAFLVKIGAIFIAVVLTYLMHRSFNKNRAQWESGTVVASNLAGFSLASIVLLSAAIIAGRLIAYTAG